MSLSATDLCDQNIQISALNCHLHMCNCRHSIQIFWVFNMKRCSIVTLCVIFKYIKIDLVKTLAMYLFYLFICFACIGFLQKMSCYCKFSRCEMKLVYFVTRYWNFKLLLLLCWTPMEQKHTVFLWYFPILIIGTWYATIINFFEFLV